MIFYDCSTAPSPRRARILLAEKGAEFETVNIDLRNGEQLSEEYKAINPQCTVPALKLDDGTLITENAGIAAYLEARYPNLPLLGTTAEEKGLVAMWTARIEFEGLMAVAEALRNGSPRMKGRAVVGPENHEQIPALAERGLARLESFFDTLDQQLDKQQYVATDHFTNADVTAVITVDFSHAVGKTPGSHHTNIHRWREMLNERPSLSL